MAQYTPKPDDDTAGVDVDLEPSALDDGADDEAEVDLDGAAARLLTPWRELGCLSALSTEEAAATAQRLASAWIAPEDGESADSEAAAADAELIQRIHDEGGHSMFVSFLSTHDGLAGEVGALLAVAQFLRTECEAIVSATRYKRAEVNDTADEIGDALLDGHLDAARERAREALTNLWKSLDASASRSKWSKRIRPTATSLQAQTASLLRGIGAVVPDDKRR